MTSQVYPEPTVGALIFNPQGKFLLVRSHKWQNQFVIPGGHIELGETMSAALKREIQEETGLEIFDIEWVGFQEFIFDEAFWKKKHFIFFDFACQTESTETQLNEEGEEYVWVTFEEASRLPVEPYTLRTLQAFQAKHSGQFAQS